MRDYNDNDKQYLVPYGLPTYTRLMFDEIGVPIRIFLIFAILCSVSDTCLSTCLGNARYNITVVAFLHFKQYQNGLESSAYYKHLLTL